MIGMATEFRTHSMQWGIEPVMVDKMLGNEPDIEHLLEGLDQISVARSTIESIGTSNLEFESVEKVRAEVEWFVQHAAERVVAADAHLMWGAVLRGSGAHELSLVTTNYDRAIELSANAEGIQVDDGFAPFDETDLSQWRGFGLDEAVPRLVKLHGSTDWYAEADSGNPVKLRHPMPLFGRAQLRLRSGRNLESALVLPSREKVLNRAPYQRLSQAFLNAADRCELAVFVGTSMRDAHIRDAARSTAARCPVFVVSPYAEEATLPEATVIAQRASMFLMSTLPAALRSPNPPEALRVASTARGSKSTNALSAVRLALDTTADALARCHAIEVLDDNGFSLDAAVVSQLLVDRAESVARYALGLVSHSPDRDELVEFARSVPHAQSEAFKHDLQLLEQLVARPNAADAN